jgi:hypothetical protein
MALTSGDAVHFDCALQHSLGAGRKESLFHRARKASPGIRFAEGGDG